MPTSAATASAVSCRSPVTMTVVEPELVQRVDRGARRRLHRVGDDERAAHLAVPAREHDRAAVVAPGAASAASSAGTVADHEVGAARRGPRRRRRSPRRPRPAGSRTRSARRARRRAARAPSAIARAIGCSDASSTEPARRSSSSTSTPGAATTSTSSMRPSVMVPVLSSTAMSTTWRRLEHLAALDHDAELRAAAGAHHDRGRRREAERARAGDDQHRDRGGERLGRRVAGAAARRRASPTAITSTTGTNTAEMRSASRCTGAFEPCASSTRRAIWASAVSLADLRRLDDEPARRVERRAEHRVADGDVDRHRLAGEHRHVDRRRAVDHACRRSRSSRPAARRTGRRPAASRPGPRRRSRAARSSRRARAAPAARGSSGRGRAPRRTCPSRSSVMIAAAVSK